MDELNDDDNYDVNGYKINNSEWDFDSFPGGYLTLYWQGGQWNLNLVDFCKYMASNENKKDVVIMLKQVLWQCLQELE